MNICWRPWQDVRWASTDRCRSWWHGRIAFWRGHHRWSITPLSFISLNAAFILDKCQPPDGWLADWLFDHKENCPINVNKESIGRFVCWLLQDQAITHQPIWWSLCKNKRVVKGEITPRPRTKSNCCFCSTASLADIILPLWSGNNYKSRRRRWRRISQVFLRNAIIAVTSYKFSFRLYQVRMAKLLTRVEPHSALLPRGRSFLCGLSYRWSSARSFISWWVIPWQ